LNDGKVNEDKKWKMMLDHFKNNPDDLMDAFPTPEGSDDEGQKAKPKGFTPKKDFSFKFGGNLKSTGLANSLAGKLRNLPERPSSRSGS